MKSPILNSPYIEPNRHFKSDERGITDEILEYRRQSSFYIPVPKAKTKEKQLELNIAEGAFGSELQKENEFINKVREKITNWRRDGYIGLTKASRELLAYWQDETRENKLFFCQIEALETLMYINEVAEKTGDAWIINEAKKASSETNPGLYRLSFKMATGSGKTVVMAMIIAYHTLNKIRYPQDTRFTDAFVIITPGITIRDRLNVLLPNDYHNYYRKRDIVSYQDLELLQQAVVLITNFHQLELRQNSRFQLGAVICHSHASNIPYSPSDDHGEKRIIEVLRKYIPDNAPTASLIFYPEGVLGRVWFPGISRPIPVSEIRVIGSTIQIISLETSAKKQFFDSDLFDRQILAFGETGQAIISSTKVGIVGVGGTGSPTAEQLIRLGVQDLVLIDKDRFEKSNLTRVYGTFASDFLGKLRKQVFSSYKADLVDRHLKQINPKAVIRSVTKNVVTHNTVSLLFDRDIIFLCTDNHWSRAIVNEVAYQYFIPTINMGVRIDAPDRVITGASGVVDVLRSDLPCLWCSGSVRAERIAVESTPPEEHHALIREGYAENVGTNAPSVVSLTTTISALSVSAFLQLITGFMGEYGKIQRLNYDILTGTVRRGTTQSLDKCVCKKVRGYGDLRRLSAIF